MAIYKPLFRTRSSEALLKFVMILNKIIKGKDLYTETQKYWMDQNLLIVEALRLLEHNNQDQGIETNSNYELATKNLITHLFPPKALKRHRRYLRRGIYKNRDTKIREFICSNDEIVKNLDKFPPFGTNQDLLEDEILDILELSIPRE